MKIRVLSTLFILTLFVVRSGSAQEPTSFDDLAPASSDVVMHPEYAESLARMYDKEHFFHDNDLERYSLGTKNKTLKYGDDGSLVLYAGNKSPGADKESNWLPAPDNFFPCTSVRIGEKRESRRESGSRRLLRSIERSLAVSQPVSIPAHANTPLQRNNPCVIC